MLREDREIDDNQKIKNIIMNCDCCRLGFCDDNSVYIVPLNFGYTENGGKRTFYFHGAAKGKKIDLIKKNGYAGFELDSNHKINVAEKPCEYSFSYSSVIGSGDVSIIDDAIEKKKALQLIMEHYTNKKDWNFTTNIINSVCVYKLDVKEITCKEHL